MRLLPFAKSGGDFPWGAKLGKVGVVRLELPIFEGLLRDRSFPLQIECIKFLLCLGDTLGLCFFTTSLFLSKENLLFLFPYF